VVMIIGAWDGVEFRCRRMSIERAMTSRVLGGRGAPGAGPRISHSTAVREGVRWPQRIGDPAGRSDGGVEDWSTLRKDGNCLLWVVGK